MAIAGNRIAADVSITLPLGTLAANSYKFRLDGPLLTVVPLEEVALAVDVYLKAIYGAYKPLMASVAQITEYVVYDLSDDEAFGPTSLNINGTSSNPMTAPGVALLANLRTGAPKHQGRKFMAGVEQTVIGTTGGVLPSAVLTMTTVAEAMINPTPLPNHPDFTLNPGVWQERPILGPLFRQFTGLSVPNIAAYQRRRKTGVGQ